MRSIKIYLLMLVSIISLPSKAEIGSAIAIITVKSEVIQSTCLINGLVKGSQQTISFPLEVGQILSSGGVGPLVTRTLQLTACPVSTNLVFTLNNVTFGSYLNDGSEAFSNLDKSSTGSTGVGVQFLNADTSTVLVPFGYSGNSSITKSLTGSMDSATFNIGARLKALTASPAQIKNGNFVSRVGFTISYQ